MKPAKDEWNWARDKRKEPIEQDAPCEHAICDPRGEPGNLEIYCRDCGVVMRAAVPVGRHMLPCGCLYDGSERRFTCYAHDRLASTVSELPK